MGFLIVLGVIVIFIGVVFIFKRYNLRKNPEALEAEKLLRREGHLVYLKARYLFGDILGILGGAGLIVLAVVFGNL